ncbi:MAG: orotidine-5'-phosphate decarboxylase [Gammaproteobacteria bacterium]|nr:orotidine-5'-phosphate decarboxylase [Gammaproteobacteria bacterium]
MVNTTYSSATHVAVALDAMTADQACSLAESLAGRVWGFKVNDLLLEEGARIIGKLSRFGNVFADAKLYDIPNTVKNGVRKLSEAGAAIITVHASGGSRMISAAAEAAGTQCSVAAVTVLTSFSTEEFCSVYGDTPENYVPKLASQAVRAGAGAVVCSPLEAAKLAALPACVQTTLVTPGIRPAWYGTADDQTRVATPNAALNSGSALLVIGRPITAAMSPVEAVERIDAELNL